VPPAENVRPFIQTGENTSPHAQKPGEQTQYVLL